MIKTFWTKTTLAVYLLLITNLSFCVFYAKADMESLVRKDSTTISKAVPSSFLYKGEKIVFMDILKAHYHLTFDALSKTVKYRATLNFRLHENGSPAFDLVVAPEMVLIGEQNIQSKTIPTPDFSTTIRMLNVSLLKGNYTAVIEGSISNFIAEKDDQNQIFFNFEPLNSDKQDRGYLEQWLPSNLDFDYFEISFDVQVLNTQTKHTVFANGNILVPEENHFKIKMNKNMRSSGVYFHLTPANALKKIELNFQSINGRTIPIQIYSSVYGRNSKNPERDYTYSNTNNLKAYVGIIQNSMHEFEQKLGPYLHDKLIVRMVNTSGMEFDGAIATHDKPEIIRHELAHLWIGRGLNFKDGNSAWLDEALVNWLNSTNSKKTEFKKVCLTRLSLPYNRRTLEGSYVEGKILVSVLDNMLLPQGGLLPFLKLTVQDYAFSEPLTLNHFVQLLDVHYPPQANLNFEEFFSSHVVCE